MTLAPPHRSILRTILTTTCLSLLPLLSVRAQESTEATWLLEGAQGGFCIWYLVDPAVAVGMAEGGTTLRPAMGMGRDTSAQLARVVRDEPKFGQWIPAAVCIGFYAAFSVDGKELSKAKADRPIVLLTSFLAADGPRTVPGARYDLLTMASNDRALGREAERAGFNFGDVSVVTREKNPGADPEVTITLGKTTFIWSGHPRGTSSVGTTRSMSFGYGGTRNSSWKVTMEARPQTVDTLVGAFRVVGNDRLAKALLASPIREVTMRDIGGEATFAFQRQGRKP